MPTVQREKPSTSSDVVSTDNSLPPPPPEVATEAVHIDNE